ncbi:MAG TPA: hypothetical protein VE869_13445 [Gemmatimonas sp.]|nr:hypothetical protein [Gemmatimonas sp.]
MITDLPALQTADVPVISGMTVNEARGWPLAGRIGFRWFACYFTLYLLQFVFDLPGLSKLSGAFEAATLPWIGRTFFGLQSVPTGSPSGSGDTLADYLLTFMFAVLASVGAALWTIRRDAPSHPRIAIWLLSAIRYFLAMALMFYGLAKVFMSQMPPPDGFRLTQTFGDLSPMGLLWAFTGASRTYEVFGGLAELVPGALLVFRRSSLLGALLAVPVLVNVVLLNFSYDVPVKLLSTHLLVMALAIVSPHARRLYAAIWANTTVPPANMTPPVTDGRLLVVRQVMQWGALLFVAGSAAFMVPSRSDRAIPRAGNGAWRVESLTGTPRRGMWESLVIDGQRARLKHSTGSAQWLALSRVDSTMLRLWSQDDNGIGGTSVPMQLTGELRGAGRSSVGTPRVADTLLLRGVQGGDSVRAVLVRRDLQKMLLVSRGFHWVQEVPYNR